MELVLLLAGGGAMLYFGAEWLVSGASRLALSLRVPKLIVGLTVVAYGTSAPEVLVGIEAAWTGHGDVALGNVIGSNIANFGLILGAAALIRPAGVDRSLRRREIPVLLLSTLAVPLLLLDGAVRAWEGLALLVLAVVYTVAMVHGARGPRSPAKAEAMAELAAEAAHAVGAPRSGRRLWQVGMTLAGIGVLLVGARLFVDGATALALAWGMSEHLVGLTIVAVGTSLPELAASVVAAVRGHSDIAVGNVIGSNIFNVLLCLGASALAGTIAGTWRELGPDLIALLLMTAFGLLFLRNERTMSRPEGAVLLTLYVGFLVYLATTLRA